MTTPDSARLAAMASWPDGSSRGESARRCAETPDEILLMVTAFPNRCRGYIHMCKLRDLHISGASRKLCHLSIKTIYYFILFYFILFYVCFTRRRSPVRSRVEPVFFLFFFIFIFLHILNLFSFFQNTSKLISAKGPEKLLINLILILIIILI